MPDKEEQIYEVSIYLKSGQTAIAFCTNIETKPNAKTGELERLVWGMPKSLDWETLMYVDPSQVSAVTIHKMD